MFWKPTMSLDHPYDLDGFQVDAIDDPVVTDDQFTEICTIEFGNSSPEERCCCEMLYALLDLSDPPFGRIRVVAADELADLDDVVDRSRRPDALTRRHLGAPCRE